MGSIVKPKINLVVSDTNPDEWQPSENQAQAIEELRRINVARNICMIRTRHGLSQAKMAELMEVSLRSYQGYEKGERTFPVSAIERLAENADVDLHEVFHSVPTQPTKKQRDYIVTIVCQAIERLQLVFNSTDMKQNNSIIAAYFDTTENTLYFDATKFDPIAKVALHRPPQTEG